ncbi:hypothetical protein PC128_g4832 [Phytophthora cactorum]|nr:hypothetical protein PC128_g4832 [Phytophthora cactorum]
MPIYTAFPKKKSPEQKSRVVVVVRGVDQVIADEDAGELEEKAAPSPSLLAENNTDEMEEKAETDPRHEVMEDIAEENEPECEPEPVSPPLEEHPEPTRNGESSGGDSSQDAESDADDWTRRPPWNTLDTADAYMIGQLPDQCSAAANESMATDEEPSGQEIVAVDAGNGMDVCMVPETLTGCQRSPLQA